MNSLQRLAVRYVPAGIMGTRRVFDRPAHKTIPEARGPPLRSAHQPGRHRGVRPHPPLPLVPRTGLRALPTPGGLRRQCRAPRPVRGHSQPGGNSPFRLPLQVALLELVLTLLVMFVVSAVATDVHAVGQAAAIAIGGYVTLPPPFAGPIAGAQRPVGGACSAALARGAAGDTCGHPRILGHRLPTPRAFG